jgi:hypothetical protein
MVISMNWVVVCDLITLFAGLVIGASIAVPRRTGRRNDF